MRILLPGNLTKKTGRVIFSGSFLSLITRQQNSNYKCQVYFDPKKKLECNSVRQFNEYVHHYDPDPTRIRRFQTLGSVLSLEKLGQTF
jgi:hypothetical protein